MTDTNPPAAYAPADRPEVDQVFATPAPPSKRKPLPAWAKIAIGVVAGLIIGAGLANAGAASQQAAGTAEPAPTVTVTADDGGRVAELEADLADCRETVDTMISAVSIVLGAFERQMDATMDAALYGATAALVAEQEAINDEINRGTDTLTTAPGC